MENTGPHWTSDGRCYYIINGQSVWAAVEADSGSPTAGIVPSVTSDFNSSAYPVDPQRSKSWPPLSTPSDTRVRLTTGIPTTLFGGGGSQGSGPALQESDHDPYRQAMDPENSKGPPRDSPFSQTYNSYKDLDEGAEAAEAQYKERLRTAAKVTKNMRSKYPGIYAGQPLETGEWHQVSAGYAYRASEAYKSAADAREKMAQEFPGYDSRSGATGHTMRLNKLRSGEERMRQKYSAHYYSHNTSDSSSTYPTTETTQQSVSSSAYPTTETTYQPVVSSSAYQQPPLQQATPDWVRDENGSSRFWNGERWVWDYEYKDESNSHKRSSRHKGKGK